MDWLFRFADPSIEWSYAFITLMVRFIGVFVVMFVMQIALQVAAFAVRRIEGVQVDAGGPAAEPVRAAPPPAVLPSEVDEGTVAAIGLALALESRVAPPPAAGTSPWAAAGRLAQLDRRPRR
jgi:hypothetical protein